MQQGDKKFIFLIIFLILGLLMTIQFRTTLIANKQKTQSELNVDKLKSQLADEISIENALKQSIRENEIKKEAYLKSYIENNNDEQLKQLKAKLDDARLKAGLTDVKGPGLIVKLDDSPARTANIDPNDSIIHDSDVVGVVNMLKAAGAQAISIDGERIIATSEQVCAGPTIRINKNRYAAPYEIKAIGDPDRMLDELEKSAIVALLREYYKIRVDITKSQDLTISKFGGNIDNLTYALEVVDK